MTLSVAWVRNISGIEELVIATDSRLRGGYAWDACPKIMLLPRSDCAVSFAGATAEAYPLMLQMFYSIASYPKSRDGATDISELKTYTLKMFNESRKFFHDFPSGSEEAEEPEVVFIFGGYSWKKKKFLLWKLKFNRKSMEFDFVSVLKKSSSNIALIGDYQKEFRRRLGEIKREKKMGRYPKWDMEPFEILRDMLREENQAEAGGSPFPLIGGAPQIVKIYQHMNCKPYAVVWPDDKGILQINQMGRILPDYENTDWWILNPDTLRSFHIHYSQPDAKKKVLEELRAMPDQIGLREGVSGEPSGI